MMTNSLAQIAGEQARHIAKTGDEPDPQALAARAAAELPARFIVHVDFATQRRTLEFSARWHSNLVQAHRNPRGPA